MERRGKLIVTGLCLALFPYCAYADQFNDLYYVDPGGVPDLSEEGKQNEAGGTTGGGTNTGGGSNQGENSNGSSGGSGGSDNGNNTSGNTEDNSSSSETENEEDEEDTEEDALESLVGDGAISGTLGGVTGGILSGGNGSIVINGSRVRSFLRKDPDIDEVLRYWKIGKGKTRPDGKTSKDRLTPGEYYALVAATLAADDEQFVEARFTAHDFEILYRSRGELFAFIPFSFPVRVLVTPYAPQGSRVKVKFPWYHWFVREYFTRSELAGELDAVMQGIAAGASEGEDIHAELFEAITLALRQKVRTITDSVILK